MDEGNSIFIKEQWILVGIAALKQAFEVYQA